MTETNYNKLIRDKIPEIIKDSGKTPIVERATGEELLELLNMEVIRKGNFTDDRKTMIAQNKARKNKRVCPHCDSANIDFVGNKKKGFSVGKAVGGAVLTGGIGTLAGFAGKKGKKDTWHCKNCGELFEMKTR